MPDYDPNNPNAGRPVNEPLRRDAPMATGRGSNMGTIGIIAAVAIALVLGLVFWNMSGNDTTATNTTPGQTTGTTGTATTPPPASPAPSSPDTGTKAPASR